MLNVQIFLSDITLPRSCGGEKESKITRKEETAGGKIRTTETVN